jgi:RecB family exonuclease
VHAETPRGTATAFSSVVHAIADFVAKGEVEADLEAMGEEVDRIWPALRFEAGWQSAAERGEAQSALARFLAYHASAERTLVSSERGVSTSIVVPTPDGSTDTIDLSGYVDRVEVDEDGRLVAIDLKNMRNPVREADVPDHGQLGVYQLILREAGLDGTPGPHPVGGAALVQLRVPAGKGSPLPKEQYQEPLEVGSPTWVEERLGAAAAVVRGEDYPAIAGGHCSYCAFKLACPTRNEGEQVVT